VSDEQRSKETPAEPESDLAMEEARRRTDEAFRRAVDKVNADRRRQGVEDMMAPFKKLA
jgi:hypothetical protein